MRILVYNNFSESPELKDFVLENHYLKSLSRGNKFVFALYSTNGILKGVAAFGIPTGTNVQNKY